VERAKNYFDGMWSVGTAQPGICINPANGEHAAQFSEASLDDALTAIGAARHAFDHGAWSRSPRLRESVLLEFAANLQARAPEIERWLVTLNGKLTREARGESPPLCLNCAFMRVWRATCGGAWPRSTTVAIRNSAVNLLAWLASSCHGMRR
jgi:acyl-CoA reductase-like NAD-dependent aldehyde dehydrogenase